MSRGLRVAMLTPRFWPEVRRGTERTVHELSARLMDRGHQPVVLTTRPGLRPKRGAEEGVSVLRLPRPPEERLRRRVLEDHMAHVPLAYAALRGGRFDVAHAWFTTDALAAARWGTVTGRPAIHSYMGIPDHPGLMWKRKRLQITLRALEECDVTVALSRYAADSFQRWLGYEAPVIPPPVDCELFRPQGERTEKPTIVCAAAIDEGRKRVDLLVRAFAHVRRERPGARLLLNRRGDPHVAARLHDPANGIELVDMDDRAGLARLYASAWASALPSFGEAFGLVLAEAMACGTPAVGAAGGGIPEVVDRPGVGRLFDGEDEAEVARAVLECLELAKDPGTATACRERALELSTERCADAYEAVYRRALDQRATRMTT